MTASDLHQIPPKSDWVRDIGDGDGMLLDAGVPIVVRAAAIPRGSEKTLLETAKAKAEWVAGRWLDFDGKSFDWQGHVARRMTLSRHQPTHRLVWRPGTETPALDLGAILTGARYARPAGYLRVAGQCCWLVTTDVVAGELAAWTHDEWDRDGEDEGRWGRDGRDVWHHTGEPNVRAGKLLVVKLR